VQESPFGYLAVFGGYRYTVYRAFRRRGRHWERVHLGPLLQEIGELLSFLFRVGLYDRAAHGSGCALSLEASVRGAPCLPFLRVIKALYGKIVSV